MKAMMPSNIISGFKKCGNYPFDPTTFQKSDFLPSSVTDHPEVQEPTPSCNGVHLTPTLASTTDIAQGVLGKVVPSS